MALTVRRARPLDAPVLAVIHARARMAGYRGLVADNLLEQTFTRDLTVGWQRRIAADDDSPVLVAELDGVICGCCVALMPSREEVQAGAVAEIELMSVQPDAWRSGVGTGLVRHALWLFRENGFQTVWLWVLEGNAPAEAFYRSFGFQPDGATMIDPWSGLTEVRMQLRIPHI